MSQDTKGRTMIGTTAPLTHPRPGALGPEQATLAPARPTGSAPLPGLPYAMSDAPTIGMRPGAGPVVRAMPEAPDVFLGQELCGYAIRRKLAEGGMGEVYEGQHTKIGRLAAIKVLKLALCRSEDVVERFYQEARAVNAIRHENIVDIYDFGRDPHGRVFFVMEYLEGEPLSARIRRGALTWPEAFPILEQTLRALKAAHDKGFVHRDLKPDNIWLRYVDGRIQVKLLDFGIAKLVGSESPRDKLTQTGSVIGTPHYMSPEQINGARDIDQRTDLYALGVITYEMFAGVTPFVGETLQAIMTGHLFREPPRLADIPTNLGVPPAIAEIIDRMLVKDAAGRYASASDVLADFHDVQGNRWPTHAETLNRVRPTRAPTLIGPPAAPATRRRRGALIGAVALAGLAIGGVAIWQAQDAAPAARPVAPVAAVAPAPGKRAEPPPAPVVDDAQRRAAAKDVLRAALRHAEPGVRWHGADALGKVKDQPAIPALSELTERDADLEVRGHSAEALTAIGAVAQARLLARLEAGAPPPLQVWYASALARLGDPAARQRLFGFARHADLAIAFKAGLTLAELGKPGDAQALAALQAVAVRVAASPAVQLDQAAEVLYRLAALHDAGARKQLYAMLEASDEATQLAGAEALARLGDDAGKALLHAVLANPASPSHLTAAVAQIPLGEYGGLDVIGQAVTSKAPDDRALAARALGDIGERTSLAALTTLQADPDWTVRIAAAAAIVAIVGLDPLVLAQASVDWTRGALASQDWAVRRAAAGVLADLPPRQAGALLAKAIADDNVEVRRIASRSAGKIRTAETAAQVTTALAREARPEVREEQVIALGRIGKVGAPAAHDALAALSDQPTRLGVLAAGSLIAVGDPAGGAKLARAIDRKQPEAMRLAAVEAAAVAGDPVVVPTFRLGVLDRVEHIRFLAAEGLATLHTEKALAVPVLTAALDSKDVDEVARAIAVLTRLGEAIRGAHTSPAELLDAADPRQRLAAVPIVRALPTGEAVPLLRRLVGDADPEVRHAGVDAIEVVKDDAEAIKLYKPLVRDADPVVRAKAEGQLARLVKPTATAAAAPTAPDPGVPDAVKLALDDVTAAGDDAKAASDDFAATAGELTTALAGAAPGAATVKHVAELPAELATAAAKLEAAAARVDAAASAASAAAGPDAMPATAKRIEDARARARQAREVATAARGQAMGAVKQADGFVKRWTKDVELLISAADVASAAGSFGDAQRKLDEAAQAFRVSGQHDAALDYGFALLYERKAKATRDPAASAKLLLQAADAYTRFVKVGAGANVRIASDRLTEIKDELAHR